MNWLLMFLMSDNIDQQLFIWDDMFLPEELEKNVARVTYIDESGIPRKLVKTSYPYFEAKDKAPLPEGIPINWPLGLLFGVVTGIFSVVAGLALKRDYKHAGQLFAGIHIIVGTVIGVPGLFLFFVSFFTDHTVTYNNENLFLSNPLTFLYIPLGVFLAFGKKFSHIWLSRISYLLAGSGLLLLFLKLLPSFDQQNALSIVLILPISLGMAFAWYLQNR
jgi:hypothetical protein